MEYKDYYKILGVDKNATQDEIKKQYRKLTRKHHPDLNPNDEKAEARFQEINEAKEVLMDPEKREKYDKYGKDWEHAEQYENARKQQQNQQQYTYSNGASDFGSHFGGDAGQYSDFFESMFGGMGGFSGSRSRANAKYKGQDFNAQLQLNLKDVYTAQKQVIQFNNQKLRLTIPAGVENGQTIKIKGKGGKGMNGGPDGDLYITFSINNDTGFKRDKSDLYKDEKLDLYVAVLGGEITVNTFDGKVKLKVKPGTANGTKVKLSGKGFPVYKKKDSFGDLYITYTIDIPTNLTNKEKELFEELKKLRNNG